MNWFRRRRFLVLLLAIGMLMLVYPVLNGVFDARLLLDALITIVFLAGLVVVYSQRTMRVVALVLGIPTLVGLWTDYALPGLTRDPMAAAFHACAATFLVVTGLQVLRTVYQEPNVSADSLFGAFCFYLLIGLVFSHIYSLIALAFPGSFRAGTDEIAQELLDYHRRHFLLAYFSFVTLATVGYGDITPASAAARGFAIVEAIMGQFYIAVLVAELVGKKVAQAIADREPG